MLTLKFKTTKIDGTCVLPTIIIEHPDSDMPRTKKTVVCFGIGRTVLEMTIIKPMPLEVAKA